MEPSGELGVDLVVLAPFGRDGRSPAPGLGVPGVPI